MLAQTETAPLQRISSKSGTMGAGRTFLQQDILPEPLPEQVSPQ